MEESAIYVSKFKWKTQLTLRELVGRWDVYALSREQELDVGQPGMTEEKDRYTLNITADGKMDIDFGQIDVTVRGIERQTPRHARESQPIGVGDHPRAWASHF